MKHATALKQLCRTLSGVQGNIALCALVPNDLLLDYCYAGLYRELAVVREDLEGLGLYEALEKALARSETLVREGKFDDAEALVLEANCWLMKATGVEDELRRMYKPAATASTRAASEAQGAAVPSAPLPQPAWRTGIAWLRRWLRRRR